MAGLDELKMKGRLAVPLSTAAQLNRESVGVPVSA